MPVNSHRNYMYLYTQSLVMETVDVVRVVLSRNSFLVKHLEKTALLWQTKWNMHLKRSVQTRECKSKSLVYRPSNEFISHEFYYHRAIRKLRCSRKKLVHIHVLHHMCLIECEIRPPKVARLCVHAHIP